MFFANLFNFSVNNIEKNIFDLGHNSFFLCLLPYEQKKEVLSAINPEAQSALKYILNIKEKFVEDIDDAKYVIQTPEKIKSDIYFYGKPYMSWCPNNGAKVLYFYGAADTRPLYLHKDWGCQAKDFILFRYGGRNTEKWHNTFSIPYIVNDNFNNVFLPKKLSISYCGYPYNWIFKKRVVDTLHQYEYSDFIIRDRWGGDCVDTDGKNYDSYNFGPSKGMRDEFFDNMERNLYALIVRGMNNASIRLFETFMMGRIPVIINSDMMLPFEDQIDYRKNTVFITDFHDIDSQIREYHDSHTEEELIEIQKQNRQIWLDYFRVDGFFYKMKQFLENYKYEKEVILK